MSSLRLLALVTLLTTLPSVAQGPAKGISADSQAVHALAHLPLTFELNRGQADAAVQFLSRGVGYNILLRNDGSDLLLRGQHAQRETFQVRLLNATPRPAVGVNELPGRVNYLRGNDPSRWIPGIPLFAKVRYRNVYPATDLIYYGKQGQLEYDFVVQSQGHPEAIRFKVAGTKQIKTQKNGDLALVGSNGEVVWHAPVMYQEVGGRRLPVRGGYRVEKDEVSFVVGKYDHRRPLIIDPALAYSTYLGGSSTDVATGIAVDSSGSAYITGNTESFDFPTTAGAFDRTCGTDGKCSPGSEGVGRDAFVTKINPSGTALVYSTYLGGSGFEEGGGIAVDSSGNAYVSGATTSTDFPGTKIGAVSVDSFAAFVVKLSSTGQSLAYAVRFGGGNCDSSGAGSTAVRVNASGNAFVAGVTDCSDFPTTTGSFQPGFGGAPSGTGGDAFVAKLNAAGTAFTYATYLGGNQRDVANDLAIDGSGNAYVTGYTSSTNFPVTPGAFQTRIPSQPTAGFGQTSAFVTKLNASGASLGYSTYLGGSFQDVGIGIAVNAGNAYVTGEANSKDFPTTPGAIQRTLSDLGGAFVTKLNTTGTALSYSTFLNGNSRDLGTSIAVNSSGNAYVTGNTFSTNFPTTTAAFQQVIASGDPENVFVAELNSTGTGLAFSSYLGGSSFENDQNFPHLALDPSRNAYVSGSTQSADFPVTPGAPQGALHSPGLFDAFAVKVRPLCALNPVNPSVTICKPTSTSALRSPVEIMAGARSTRKVRLTQIYLDGKKIYQVPLAAIDVKLPIANGTHRLTVQSFDTANTVVKKSITITVSP